MMLYKQLTTKQIQLGARSVLDYDFGEEAILVPSPESKVFLHWLTEKGAIRSTFTMTYATKVVGKVRLTNAKDTQVDIQVLTNW
jgi:hypothetical protein